MQVHTGLRVDSSRNGRSFEDYPEGNGTSAKQVEIMKGEASRGVGRGVDGMSPRAVDVGEMENHDSGTLHHESDGQNAYKRAIRHGFAQARQTLPTSLDPIFPPVFFQAEEVVPVGDSGAQDTKGCGDVSVIVGVVGSRLQGEHHCVRSGQIVLGAALGVERNVRDNVQRIVVDLLPFSDGMDKRYWCGVSQLLRVLRGATGPGLGSTEYPDFKQMSGQCHCACVLGIFDGITKRQLTCGRAMQLFDNPCRSTLLRHNLCIV